VINDIAQNIIQILLLSTVKYDNGMDSSFNKNLFRQDLQDKQDFFFFISRMEMKKTNAPKAQRYISN